MNPEYAVLLHFVQIIDEMIWEGARELYRTPALNTYHRSVELIGAAAEISSAGLNSNILEPIFEELLYFSQKDPVIITSYSDSLEQLNALAKPSQSMQERVGAVRLFHDTIRVGYLKRCRDLIQMLVAANNVSYDNELSIITGIFASHLINDGVSARYISDCLHRHFLYRELDKPRVRELQDFFSRFPASSSTFSVYVKVTNRLLDLVVGSRSAKRSTYKPESEAVPSPPQETEYEQIVFDQVEARDYLAARISCERILGTARAVAYSGDPRADVAWSTDIFVRDGTSTRKTQSVTDALLQRHKIIQDKVNSIITLRNSVIVRPGLGDRDRNRLTNSLLGYANAFHSEHPSTQLISLWLSLEGLLPIPKSGDKRINSFVVEVLASQRRIYLKHLFEWLFVDFLRMYKDDFLDVIDQIKGYKNRESKFVAALCFPEWKIISDKLWNIAEHSPLARERGLVLHRAAKDCAVFYKMLESHCDSVGWQIQRIYRERNRIVHQANPSLSVPTLIANLNEYYLNTIEVLFDFAEQYRELSVDEMFLRIRLEEQYRRESIKKLKDCPLTKMNSTRVLGFDLNASQ